MKKAQLFSDLAHCEAGGGRMKISVSVFQTKRAVKQEAVG